MIEVKHCDCFDGIKNIEENFLDLVITSPPYNVDLGNNKEVTVSIPPINKLMGILDTFL